MKRSFSLPNGTKTGKTNFLEKVQSFAKNAVVPGMGSPQFPTVFPTNTAQLQQAVPNTTMGTPVGNVGVNPNIAMGIPQTQIPMGGMVNPVSAMSSVTATGMAEAFMVLYRMITIIVALIFMLIVVFTFRDVIYYMIVEAKQRWKRIYDRNMYNKDTTDVDALRYISATAAEDETYNIFKTQRFISYILMFVGVAVIILGVQIGIFFGMKIWAIFNGRVFNERMQIPIKLMAVLLIIVVGGFAIKDVYNERFTKRVQASLVDVRTQLTAIRTYIYTNLSTNPVFLRALIADDLDTMIDVISDVLKTKKGNCTDTTKPCDSDVESMIFSMNLYSYLRYQIPSSDPNFENVLKLFTPEGVSSRMVDPTMYFYYKQPIYIPNLYPTIREKVGTNPFYPPSGSAAEKQRLGATRERIMMLNVNNKMQELNTKLTRLYNLASGKVNVGTYLLVVALVVLIFCVVLLVLFFPELQPYIPIVIDYAKRIWGSRKSDNVGAAKGD